MKRSKLLPILFLCSFSSLAYEIALTRIFSISLWYHFAFMIVSIAMLGIGASGTVLSLFPKLKDPSRLGTYSLFVGISISASYLVSNQIHFDPVKLSWSWAQLFYVTFYYLILAVPFFLVGLVISTAFASFSGESALLYGVDLLGAGMGSLGVLALMIVAAPDQAVFLISLLALCGAFIGGGKGLRAISLILMLIGIAMAVFQPEFSRVRLSPFKGLPIALRYPGAEHLKTFHNPFSRIDLFRSPAVRFAPGLSLKYLDPIPEQVGFSIDGGEVNAVTSTKDGIRMDFLKHLPTALPYELAKREDVLILDPKGGLQVLVAKHYSARNIYKVETTPHLTGILRREFQSFSDDIYFRDTWSGLGRSWLRGKPEAFDLIDLSFLGAMPSGSFGFSEDYRYTVEAFTEYLDHLRPGGIFSISLFILPPPRVELRLLNTIIKAMEEMGTKDVQDRIAAIRSWGSLCIMAKQSPFNPAEIERIKDFSKDRRFDLVYYPGISEEETNLYVRTVSNEHFVAFKHLLDPGTREEFSDKYLFDIAPVRDENPFFHYYLKLKNIKPIYRVMGEKWQYFIEEGYLLPAVFLQVLFLSLVIMFFPLMAKRGLSKPGDEPGGTSSVFPLRRLSFFALIGLGFMFVEVSLIQKMILPLEHPSYAVAIVLTSLLISSGIGSLLSYKVPFLRKSAITIVLIFLIVVYSLLFPHASEAISPYSMTSKIVLVFVLLIPLGLFMGIPFPSALRTLGEEDPSLIPWAWAINGCFSVLAPLLAMMLAMAMGFNFVLWTGAGLYLLAYSIMLQHRDGVGPL